MKEIEHKVVSVEVKKPIVVEDVKRVKKIQYLKQKSPKDDFKIGKYPFLNKCVKIRNI